MGSECAQEAEKQGFGHRNGAICARQYSFGYKISQKRAQAAETLVFGHKNGSKRAREHSFGHKTAPKRSRKEENSKLGNKMVSKCAQEGKCGCLGTRTVLFARLVQQVQNGFECDSAVAAQANLAGTAGSVSLHARGGFCAVCKGSFYLTAKHP